METKVLTEEQKQEIESTVQAFSFLYSVYLEEAGLLKKKDSIEELLSNIENSNGTNTKQ